MKPHRDTPQRRVRLWLHDRVCMSGCTGERRDGHAKRHADDARYIVRYVKSGGDDAGFAAVLHPVFCIDQRRRECEQGVAHRAELISRGNVTRMRGIVAGTVAR